MAIVGHGPSQSTCEDCYGVQITPLSDRTAAPAVHIQITGRYAYQGVLFLVRNMATHKVVGEFFNFDENLFTSVACDDDEEPDFNEIDIDKYTVLGHIDPKLKEWPVHLDWMMTTDALNNSVTELELQGMVVVRHL
ncbi:hypothetical protein BDF20DRAFT_663544 [Mycotypha africana]|uniref:uncharacterized protein n=1 Tax=Mycotypha africana TaxID=64632 RepID=UPI002301663C|nr:uncharacterized protein BDF20DRAFT_663544 [Mycotypha africana]KAI8973637.1 hypothetical protein BDF20DRAFT_663544 [Mycotypha africana]